MHSDLQIIEELENNLKVLVPIPNCDIQIEKRISSNIGAIPDFMAKVNFRNHRFEMAGETVSQKYLPIFKDKISKLKAYMELHQGIAGLIVSPYLSKSKRDECKSEDINYIDLSGNVFINLDGLYVEREGFPNRFPEQRGGRNLFSDKASLVLRAMIPEKGKIWGIRQLAEEANLDPGFVSRLARELEERNYINRSGSKIKLREPKLILEDWIGDYNYKKNHEYKFFCMAESPMQIMDRMRDLRMGEKYVLSFHAGASLIAPHAVFDQVHIYVKNQEDMQIFREKLNLMGSDQGANIILAIPFYRHSAFYRKQRAKGLWVASDIQLYLDLYHFPLRGLEQAEYLYEKRLKPLIEE